MTQSTETGKTRVWYCAFCGKSKGEVRTLIAGPSVFICCECVNLCNEILAENNADYAQKAASVSEEASELKAETLLVALRHYPPETRFRIARLPDRPVVPLAGKLPPGHDN